MNPGQRGFSGGAVTTIALIAVLIAGLVGWLVGQEGQDRLGPSGPTPSERGQELAGAAPLNAGLSLPHPDVLANSARTSDLPVTTSPGATAENGPYLMPIEEILELAEKDFLPNELRNNALKQGWGPWLTGMSRYEASRKLAMKLTEVQFAEVLELEAGFNRDLDAIATLYMEDYNQALWETWVNKQWHFEDPIDVDKNSYRERMPGENALVFPGKAIYYTSPYERHPHLNAHIAARQELIIRRKRTLVDWAVATRGEKWFPQPGDEKDFE